MKIIKKFKRSQILLFGSFLLLIGVIVISYSHLQVLKEDVFEQVRLSLLDSVDSSENEITTTVTDATNINNLDKTEESTSTNSNFSYNYIGYLEIPRISLKRGFLSKEDRYNSIEYNIAVSNDADYPDVENGNFILMAHSGDAYISFFAYLYKLQIGDIAKVTYNGKKYNYSLVKIEEQEKTGVVAIHRPNYNIKGLTLITCTKDNDRAQSIYIFELV